VYFLYVFHLREGRPRGQIVLEGFYAVGRAFDMRLDAPVWQITHVASDLMARGGALREKTVADLLHFPANQKPSPGLHHQTRLVP
jgi:hypothetical protein